MDNKEEILVDAQDIINSIVNDYYTAGIKAEVLIDMLLTPVLTRILNDCKKVAGKWEFITKEFPVLKNENGDFRNYNADYLICNDERIYLIELKTNTSSEDKKQIARYLKLLKQCDGKSFNETLGQDFCKLLSHIYKTEIADIAHMQDGIKKILGNNNSDSINTDKAIEYLKRKAVTGSGKYLFQAGQIIDAKPDSWLDKTVGLIYIVPSRSSFENLLVKVAGEAKYEYNEKDIIVVGFKEDILPVLDKEAKKNKYMEMVYITINELFGDNNA